MRSGEARLRKGILWRALGWCVLPLRRIAVLAFGLCFVYALVLKLNGPQYLLNAYLKKVLPSDVLVNVGTVSKAFPFVFHIDEITVASPKGEQAKIREIDFRWHGTRISGTVAEVKLTPDSQKETKAASQRILDMYEVLRTQVPKIALLKCVQTFTVRSIHGKTPAERTSVQIRTLADKKLLYARTTIGDKILRAAIQADWEHPFGYRITLQKGTTVLWNVWGCVAVNASFCQLTGNISKPEKKRDLDKGAFNLTVYHDQIPTLIGGKGGHEALITGTLSKGEKIIRVRGAVDRTATVEVIQKDVPTVPLAVLKIRNDTRGLTFDMVHDAPQSHLSFQGTLIGAWPYLELEVRDISGKWKAHTLTLPSLKYSVQTKQLALSTITVNQIPIRATSFSLNPEVEAPNTLTFPVRDLMSEDRTLHFGQLTVAAQVVFAKAENMGKEAHLVVSFSLKPKKHSPKVLVQVLGLGVRGNVVLSRGELSIQGLVIDSGDGARCEGELKFQTPSLMDLASGLRRTFLENLTKAPLIPAEDIRSCVLISGRLQGTLSLVPIAITLTTGDRISGKVTTDIQLGGTLAHPVLTGPFVLDRGYYENVNNGIILKNVSLKATGDGDQMVIHEIRLTDGTSVARRCGTPTGRLTFPIAQPPKGFAGGYGSLRFWTPEDAVWAPWLTVRLRLNTLQVAYSKLVKGRVSGDVVLEGSLLGRSEQPVITGTATVDGMLITIETTQVLPLPAEKWHVTERVSNVQSFYVGEQEKKVFKNEIKGERPMQPVCVDGPAYQQFALDVTLKSGRILLQDEALRCFLVGTMTARGPLPNPYLVGTMTVDSSTPGTYDFLGKRLTIVRGTVTYDEKVLNDPLLDVTLKITLSGSDIFVTITGRLSHVHIGLRSNPAMSNEAILSLLLFGQGIDALSPNQNVQVKAFASQMLQGDGNPLGFLDHLRGKLRLDSFEILETQDLESGETTQSVRFGKSLKKAHIYFGQDLSSKSNTKVTLRYDLTSEIGLEANLSTLREASGVGVQWLRRY